MADATTVWFHRPQMRCVIGAHVKHAHYFDHVRRLPGHTPIISFTSSPGLPLNPEQHRLWPPRKGAYAERWQPRAPDILFLTGFDWRYVNANGFDALPNPRIDLVQSLGHDGAHFRGDPRDRDAELRSYLKLRAVRICVSYEVAESVRATGLANGPVFTVPNGMDTHLVSMRRFAASLLPRQRRSVVVVGYKRPDLAKALSECLNEAKVPHRLLLGFLSRDKFLATLAEADVSVCLPYAEEGFYLPALEAMACGSTVVTLDCIGNRSFCRNDQNCLIAPPDPSALAAAVIRALALCTKGRKALRRQANETVRRHSVAKERQRFYEILGDIRRIW